ncbi:hypothetical protein AB0I89_24015 [Micromonospora sp. NPDC049801]|uniref:hypothetical protein n=1 Tax=unclassified Micromonospora TaxID=2617518 RepID=UPI0033D636F0
MTERTDTSQPESICSDGYPEHLYHRTYSGPNGTAWECTRCGAEDSSNTESSDEE